MEDEKKKQEGSLEDKFRELDEILSKMEKEDISLEDAFSLYETGMKKIRECNEKLDLVEKRMLVIAGEGRELTEDQD